MKKIFLNEYYEIISEPIMLKQAITVQHAELPEVDDELSVSLRIKLKSHHSDWSTVFRKGRRIYFLRFLDSLFFKLCLN
jgi:hypothetical protein